MTRTLLALLLAATAPAAALAQEAEIPAAVEARKGLMKNFSFNLSILGDMAKGEVDYDAERAQTAADRLTKLTDLDQAGYWPEGTSSDQVEQSRALPAIWENMEEFRSGFEKLHEATLSMRDVAGNGREAVAGQMKALGDACGACHEDYRMSDD